MLLRPAKGVHSRVGDGVNVSPSSLCSALLLLQLRSLEQKGGTAHVHVRNTTAFSRVSGAVPPLTAALAVYPHLATFIQVYLNPHREALPPRALAVQIIKHHSAALTRLYQRRVRRRLRARLRIVHSTRELRRARGR